MIELSNDTAYDVDVTFLQSITDTLTKKDIELLVVDAKEIQEIAGLRYLVLLPDNDKLQNIYEAMGFLNLPRENWLYIKLS